MVSKQIRLSRQAYEALAVHKRENESFSELILRLVRKNGSMDECWGLWRVSNTDMKVSEAIDNSWAIWDAELKRSFSSHDR